MIQVNRILRKIPFFYGLDEETLGFIARCAKATTINAGTIIFNEGDQGDRMYLIVKGKVEVYKTDHNGHETILATLTTSDIFGEMSLLDDLTRSASAKTIEDTVLLNLLRKDFQLFLKNNFSVSLKILDTLSRKLREADEKLTDQNTRAFPLGN